MNNKKIYRHIADLPSGTASDTLTEGCLVLEGGGWKGLYTVGVLDCMMKNDINFSSVVGVSAGALSAIGYVSGQIGWGARIDLTYRHDKNYCGIGAFKRDKGITGFSYLFDDILKELPLDEKRLMDPSRRLAVTATNLNTGTIHRITLLMNHINSIKRPSLGNKSPYEMIPKGDEDWEWLMQLTGMDAIPADDVHLNPALLKHKP